MVKKDNKKIPEKKVELEEESIDESVEDVEEDSFPSEDEMEEEISKENKKSRINAIEKNIEALDIIENNTGVIYLGHLPWGFDDFGIKKYFNQFGKITRIVVPRSKKSGRTKGYAFIEFEDKEVAQIAAKTMNNYILFDKVLKCHIVEDSAKHNLIFKKWKRKFKFHDKYQNYVQEKNKFKSKEEMKEQVKIMLEREESKRNKLAELGITYEFPGFKALIEKQRPLVKKAKVEAKPEKATEKVEKEQKNQKGKNTKTEKAEAKPEKVVEKVVEKAPKVEKAKAAPKTAPKAEKAKAAPVEATKRATRKK